MVGFGENAKKNFLLDKYKVDIFFCITAATLICRLYCLFYANILSQKRQYAALHYSR